MRSTLGIQCSFSSLFIIRLVATTPPSALTRYPPLPIFLHTTSPSLVREIFTHTLDSHNKRMERTEDVWVWMNVMVSDPKTILLTVVFLAEYGSGLLLLYTSLRPPSPSSHHPFSSTHNDKDSLRSASEYVHQLVWTGMLNVVSALACYFLVCSHPITSTLTHSSHSLYPHRFPISHILLLSLSCEHTPPPHNTLFLIILT